MNVQQRILNGAGNANAVRSDAGIGIGTKLRGTGAASGECNGKGNGGWSPEQLPLEMSRLDGPAEAKASGTERVDSLLVHANPILKATEPCRFCQASGRKTPPEWPTISPSIPTV